MTRTQLQFPEALYLRLKQIAREKDWSLAEVIRRAAEEFAMRFPEDRVPGAEWSLPRIDGGGIKVPLDQLHDLSAEEQLNRTVA